MKRTIPITLADGVFLAHFSERGLARLEWPTAAQQKGGLGGRAACSENPFVVPPSGGPGKTSIQPRPPEGGTTNDASEQDFTPRLRLWIGQTHAALERVLAGKCPRKLPPLDLSDGTSFQQEVWRLLCHIPSGQTRTYAELASALGRPRAARAVGNACGANPVPLLVPCHRVVPSSGGLGGFSGPIEWKRLLLERETRKSP